MEDALVTAFYYIRVEYNTEHVGYGPTLEYRITVQHLFTYWENSFSFDLQKKDKLMLLN